MATREVIRVAESNATVVGDVHHRATALFPPLPSRVEDLHDAIRATLQAAVREGRLVTPAFKVSKLLADPRETKREEGRPVYAFWGGHLVASGAKDFNRATLSKESALVRDDGGILHFSVSLLAPTNDQLLEMHSYAFELYFPDDSAPRPFPFIRLDLNGPKHVNTARELRSHLHPGHDDVTVPSLVLHPVEALHFLLSGIRLPDSPRAQ